MNESEKICTRCKLSYPLTEFYTTKRPWCKPCCRVVSRERNRGTVLRIVKTPEEVEITKGLHRVMGNVYVSAHNKKKACINDITTKMLRGYYKLQGGKCFYTGVKMKLSSDLLKDPMLISVDRIDSSKGYIDGNVVLCCLGMNWLKNIHTDKLMFECLNLFYIGAKSLGKI